MKTISVAAIGMAFVLSVLPAICSAAEGKVSERARALHFKSIVVDTHDDTTQRLLDPAFDLGVRHADGSIDIPRMKDGGLGAIFFSIYIPGTITGPEAVTGALAQIAAVRRQVEHHPHDLTLAGTAEEVRLARAEQRIAVLMGVEGGHMINDNLANLDQFFRLGVRYMTLTHMVNTSWADSSTDVPAHKGLTALGRDVVKRMNRLGMIIDVSHVSDKTFYDVLAESTAPVIASHSSCRALCDAPRNMSDRMIRDLAAKGGVIQINYHMGFLDQGYRDAMEAEGGRIRREIEARVDQHCGKDEACQIIQMSRLARDYVGAGKLPRVSWTRIVDHIDHAVKLAGPDHVGLGSDFDGADMPYGMEDASHLPQITEALLAKGYSEADISKILGGNTLRVLAEVEAFASRMGRSQASAP